MNNIDEIFKMFDWNEDEAIQKKGIELANNIDDLSYFVLPDVGKSVWENCARVLVGKTDEELLPYLDEILKWLYDINWPGSFIIIDRLIKYKNTDGLASKIIDLVNLTENMTLIENLSYLMKNEDLKNKIYNMNIDVFYELNPDIIINKLSSNNPKYIQDEGLNLAKKLKNIYVFTISNIQFDYKKDVLKNCAKVLASKTDEELSIYLSDLLEWFDDVNNPGYDIIFNRLLEYKKRNDLEKEINFCINKALKFNMNSWCVNLKKILNIIHNYNIKEE